MTVLLTGAAGFIGFHVAQALLARGDAVIGIDNLNAYYSVRLKQARLDRLRAHANFTFHQIDLADRDAVLALPVQHPAITRIVHLGAQAGVHFSQQDPFAYIASNVTGHLAVLEAARRLKKLSHLVYASSSSVYGSNTALPFAESDRVDAPLSVYAATKRADELLSHVYGHLYALPQTGLRFFTVYGPWGRPDMAYFRFARAIMAGEPITLFDNGALRRDFTYIDDVTAGVIACLDQPPGAGQGASVLNLGNHRSERVDALLALIERGLGRKAVIRFASRPAADVPETFAAIEALAARTGFAPQTRLEDGIARFCAWFQEFHALAEMSEKNS